MVKDRNLTRWIFVLPAMIIVGLLFVYPFFSSIFYSFTNKHLIMPTYKFVGFDNYIKVLSDPNFFNAFFNSLKWTIFSLVGQVLVGFALALALHRIKKFKKLYRTLLIIPWAFPTIVIAFSWQWILNGVYGYLPNIIVKLGLMELAPSFLTDSTWAFICLVFINIWFGAPMIMVNVLSALQTVPQEQFEAAKIDGASTFQVFRYITFPHIKVVVGLLIVLRTVWIFNNFDIIYLITGGGPSNATMTLPIFAYNLGWGTKLLGRASAVTVLLFIFLLTVCFIYFGIISKWEKEGAK
ncbi:TPA: sugar ABC transporter permease [Streptococcus suis]|uniref:ABC transporter permease SP1689 n=3 Tax=Streptococcus suis TaxID=1307 RepID=A0A0Z8C6V6_STRSU|nr:sugar ABC transporter permease [Streptococcus suis]MBS8103953.1 sugar ABC transporter permease [Streptococcus suis]MCK4041539.1 sugar ABC transporter permease [Streptococcus suis]NQI12482.1 sugar ABC transporter permease [Streptococcus suis]NQS07370.1 sugar ABC transporter permease [Streptococcus suis]TII06629.1 sugar ABC transporter permease [Streptococcus suis]